MAGRWRLAVLIALAACSGRARPGLPGADPYATSRLMGADGREVGIATFSRGSDGAQLAISAGNLSPGAHGLHVHEHGSCTAPEFESAGAHLNPAGREHGLENPEGPHLGDLPNLVVGPEGSVDTTLEITDSLLEAGSASLFDADGSALVIHAGPDDHVSDPAGNSGDRVACGVIERS